MQRPASTGSVSIRHERRALWGGLTMGFGFGGLFDSVLLHQILQWHNVISARVVPDTVGHLRTNILADGLLSAAMVVVLGIGFALLWSASALGRMPARQLIGALMLGWGGFNVYDSVVHHWLLQLHHIREGPGHSELAYDLGFFLFALILLGVGAMLIRDLRR
ncbi:DUF2243 domain-containing protein [Deinococcus peraridilitoris]|nr:DUF2243 domain-containing protein [Deinococcus peraridilitoris]